MTCLPASWVTVDALRVQHGWGGAWQGSLAWMLKYCASTVWCMELAPSPARTYTGGSQHGCSMTVSLQNIDEHVLFLRLILP